MRLNFKKVSAIAVSALMAGLTIGVAAAANYPVPFVTSGNPNVAIVYGANAALSDAVQAGNIEANLQSFMTGSSATTASTSGEIVPLFTAGSKVYVNQSLTVKSLVTKQDLPTTLADQSFSGNVQATITHQILMGAFPRITFEKQPTSSDDPNYALKLSTQYSNYLYNATATFSRQINFTDSNSAGQTLTLFGTPFVVSSSTDTTNLVLFRSAQKIQLDSATNPSTNVTVNGKNYIVTIVSATDTSATLSVTDTSTGNIDQQKVTSSTSKTIVGVSIAVLNSYGSSGTSSLGAAVLVGANKLTLADGNAVTQGDSATPIDGTRVSFAGANPSNLTSITVSVFANNSDNDAVKSGVDFVDPVFKTFKVSNAGLNVEPNSSSREQISFTPESTDKMDIGFTDYRGNSKTLVWATNNSGALTLTYSTDQNNISIAEGRILKLNDYVVVGNENQGYLVRLSNINNASGTDFTKDTLQFTDVMSGDLYSTSWSSKGVGTVVIGGKSYTVKYVGDPSGDKMGWNTTLGYPDTSSINDVILYPTIQTSKGAKIQLYKPHLLYLNGYDSINGSVNVAGVDIVSNIKIPNGNGYTTIAVAPGVGEANWTIGGAANSMILNGSGATGQSVTIPAGEIEWKFVNNLTGGSLPGVLNATYVYAVLPGTSATINNTAVIVYEGKDNNNNYNAWVYTLDNSAGPIGMSQSPKDTWSNASSPWSSSRYSNNKLTDKADYYGTITTVDTTTSNQPQIRVSYPSDQAFTQLYVGASGSGVTPGVAGGASKLGNVLVTDNQVSSVSSKNLVVVGGSCINSVAAAVLGGAYCGPDFTTKTNVGTGQFLIKSVQNFYTQGSMVLLVAGYDASDTVAAANYLQNNAIATDDGKTYTGITATNVATLVTSS